MKVAILGAAGFLGRSLGENPAGAGMEVIATTRQPVVFAHDGIRNIAAPFTHGNDSIRPLRDGAAIVHAASISTPGSSAPQPQLDGNSRTAFGLLEALQEFPGNRLVYLSSGDTLYGDGDQPMPEDAPLRRLFQPAPTVDVRAIVLDDSVAKAAFGWNPSMDMDQGLRRSREWA